MNALAEVNDCFGVLFQYTNLGAALAQIPRFYRRMPVQPVPDIGADFTRCAVWRRYALSRATLQGDAELAAAAENRSDETIRSLFPV